MNILFIGAGKMATAMANGMVEKGGFDCTALSAVDINEEARSIFFNATGIECTPSADEHLAGAGVIVLAVKPQTAADAVAKIADNCEGKLIISIAAGITISTLSEWFSTDLIIRVMPNTPLMIGVGASAFSCGDGVSESDCTVVKSIFEPIGILHRVAENMMDAVTALSGSGPAYVFEMIQAMTDAGINAGLSKEDSLDLTVQTVLGAAGMVEKKMGTPDELRSAVTSPGGTTAAALAVFTQAGFRALVNDAVQAAYARSVDLGKETD